MQIDQLYCRESRHRGKHGHVSYRYAVYARTREGKAVKFATGLNDPATALFIEQRLEQVMGLTDASVAGAFTG
jgi:hypothetical protein